MREIEFRGKPKHGKNKGFVYGNLRIIADYVGIETLTINPPDAVDTEVIPKTVGQYTSLHDKNGGKIFEGDIVKITTPNDEECIADVFFLDGEWVVDGKDPASLFCQIDIGHGIEVIGNIHDNPKLLERNSEETNK